MSQDNYISFLLEEGFIIAGKPSPFVHLERDPRDPDYFIHSVRAHKTATVVVKESDGTEYEQHLEPAREHRP